MELLTLGPALSWGISCVVLLKTLQPLQGRGYYYWHFVDEETEKQVVLWLSHHPGDSRNSSPASACGAYSLNRFSLVAMISLTSPRILYLTLTTVLGSWPSFHLYRYSSLYYFINTCLVIPYFRLVSMYSWKSIFFNHFSKFFDSLWIPIQSFKRLLTPLNLIPWKT